MSNHGKLKAWIEDHLDYPHDHCLIWPYGRNSAGYGLIYIDGRNTYAHRYMCERTKGPPPAPEYQTAHSCDRGPDGCVNWRHLSWKTATDNQLDRKDGPGRPQRRLTIAQVDEIRELKGREHAHDTARRFNTSETNIRRIQSGKTWRKDRTDRRIFTDDEIRAIRAFRGTIAECAKQFQAKHTAISNIRNRRFYDHVSDLPSEAA